MGPSAKEEVFGPEVDLFVINLLIKCMSCWIGNGCCINLCGPELILTENFV